MPDRDRSRSRDQSGSRSRDRGRDRDRDRSRRKEKERSRSGSRDEERDPSPTYSIEDLWRRLEHLGSWKGLGKKEKMRATLNGAEKEDLQALERKLENKLIRGYRSSCLRTALSILESGFEVQQTHLDRLFQQSVQRPGVHQVCMALKLLQIIPGAGIGVESFLRGLGVLVQRNAPVQLLRTWLNLGLPRTAKPLQAVPYDYDDEEKQMASQELEDAVGVITDDEEDNKMKSRRAIYVTGAKARPELNGRYERNDDISAHGRPVYEKIVEKKREKKGKGKDGKGGPSDLKRLLMPHMVDDEDEIMQEVLVIHYRKVNDARNGWWISRDNCGGMGLAWNARETKGPPTGGWFVIRDRNKLPDPIQLVDPAKLGEVEAKRRSKEAEKALKNLNPQRLCGRLTTKDKNVQAAEYFGHFCMLMHLEHMEELRQIKRRTERLPEAELQRLGWCLDGLPCQGVFGQRAPKKVTIIGWEDPGSEMGALLLPPNVQFDRLKFKRGDSVTLTESRQQVRKGERLEKIGDGFIADLRPPGKNGGDSQLIVRLRGCWPDDANLRRWRVDKGANSTLYERQLQALLNLVSTKKDDLPRVSELLITAKVGLADSWAGMWRRGGEITDDEKRRAAEEADAAEKDLRKKPCQKLAKLNPGGTDSDKLDRALKEVKNLSHLNQSQRDAVRSALRQTCTIIQGPPGTGKTHVSVQIMKMWSKTLDLSPLLATSDSNVAVDNIAMGLIKEGVKAVRVGRPDKINRILEEITLECLLDKEKEELGNLKFTTRYKSKSRSKSGSPRIKRRVSSSKSRSRSGSKSKKKSGDEAPDLPEARVKTKGKGKGKKKGGGKADFDLQMRILADADVLCTTTISSGGDFFSKFAFAGVLVDEAAQATELAAVVPLILRGTQRLVLVGDQCQLPPTVQSSEAEERGLSLSLYSRLVDGGGLTPFLLDTQFRSHPLIAEFSSKTFYAGRIKNGVEAKDRKPPRGLAWPSTGAPILFIDSQFEETVEGESKFNNGEADLITKIVNDVFYQRELEITDVGVVTPYVAQVRILKRQLKNIIPEGSDPELLEVASVDNFQGREKELIVFSAVRSNRTGTVGFLADWRRLNVMLTRAKRGLVVVGNSRTLRSDPHWEKWMQFAQRCAAGYTRTPSPEREAKEVVPLDETEAQRESRLKKERQEAARRLSMAIRFPGMAGSKKKSRSRSFSPGDLQGSSDSHMKVTGGRMKPRKRTPSPERKPLKVMKEVGIGRKAKASEFDTPAAKAKAKAKNKPQVMAESDDEEVAFSD